jgi:hypothetical protein
MAEVTPAAAHLSGSARDPHQALTLLRKGGGSQRHDDKAHPPPPSPEATRPSPMLEVAR